MQATIFKPTKTAMQSGLRNTKKWLVKFEHDGSRYVDSLMGWTGSKDMLQETTLTFPSKEAAENYVKKYYPDYEISYPHESKKVKKNYADNFTD
ncbi:MAG: ETC complex I subunit [Sphingobacteriia bacterium]|nr:ETC complex I subunit [Sphingobacteriia bacterium]